MTVSRRSRTFAALLAGVALLMPACRKGCTETSIEARDAAFVTVPDAASSSVLEARLTVDGAPLAGRQIEFHVRVGSDHELAGYARTDDDGGARLDMKENLAELVDDADSDSYVAGFRGRGKYCGSMDRAELELVGTP